MAAGGGRLLVEEGADGRCVFAPSSFTSFVKSLGRYDAEVAVEVPVSPTQCALDLFPNLPKGVTGVPFMCSREGLVDTWTLDAAVEGILIDTFVDVDATNQAFQVASCFG